MELRDDPVTHACPTDSDPQAESLAESGVAGQEAHIQEDEEYSLEEAWR